MKEKLLAFLLAVLFTLGLNAQTHFPLYNPNHNYSAGNDTDSTEKLIAKWNTALSAAQKQVNASNQNFQAFTNFYQSYLDSERSAIYPQVKTKKLNPSNMNSYLNSKIPGSFVLRRIIHCLKKNMQG